MTAPMSMVALSMQEKERKRRLRDQAWSKTAWEDTENETTNRYGVAPTVTQPPTASNVPEEVWSSRLAGVDQYGQAATAGAKGSAATKQARRSQISFNNWKKQQEESLKKMQASFAQSQKAMQEEYARRLNEQQAGQRGATVTYSPNGNSSAGIQAGQYDFGNETDNNIARWARQAGWAEEQLPTLVAVARDESGGSPTAINDRNRNGSIDYGLMQTNTIHRGSSFIPQGYYEGGWRDPVTNLKVAKAIYDQSGNWSPWVTYNNGLKYKPQYSRRTFSAAPIQSGGNTNITGNGQLRTSIVQTAMKYIGTPYVFAGNSLTQGVDCSGLLHEVFELFNIKSPRTADEYSHPERWARNGSYGGAKSVTGYRTSINNLQPGDLVAWQGGWRGPNLVGHIAFYAGNGEIVEAPRTGLNVRRRALTSREQNRLIGIKLRYEGE